MITELILDSIIVVLNFLVSLIPDMTMDTTSFENGMNYMVDIWTGIKVIFPVNAFISMFITLILVNNFGIIWKIIMRVWDALPFT